MSTASETRTLLDRILWLQRAAASDAVPLTCCDALALARRRADRDAELRELLADLGAELVDALVDGTATNLIAVLAESPRAGAASPRGDVPAVTAEPAPLDQPEATAPEAPPTSAAAPAPAPPLRREPQPRPVTVTSEVIRELKARLAQNGLARESRASARVQDEAHRQREKLQWYLEAFGPTPAGLGEPAAVRRELERLERLVPEPPRHWAEAGKEANFSLTSWAAARARAAQDAAREMVLANEGKRLDQLFPRLSRHSTASKPGMVHGLARVHQPHGSSWLEDARGHERLLRGMLTGEPASPSLVLPPPPNFDDALRQLTEDVRGGLDGAGFCQRARALLAEGLQPSETRLVRLAQPYLANLQCDDFIALRRAVERAVAREADPDAEGDTTLLPDWPWFSFTRGKRCALVGGEPRPERRERLQEVFGFASLEWLPNPTRGVRRVHALTQKMRSGSLDVVIVLRAFISHKVSDKLFAVESPTCRTILADNYGVTQVRLGIERFLAAAVPESEVASLSAPAP